jgi:sulfoquinovosidase
VHARIRGGLVATLAAGAVGLLAFAASASARDLVVRGPSGTRVLITRAPFGLAFFDARGRVVLISTPATARSLHLGRVTQRQYGFQDPPPPTLYAPLAFVVGRQMITQTPSGEWEGTLASVTTAGIEYRAASVIKVSHQGGAVRLTLATTDPSGRRLVVRIAPGRGRAFTVSARPVPARGVAAIAVSFRAGRREAFRGFGGRHNGLDQHGNEFFNWIDQENFSSGSRTGLALPSLDSRYLFPNGPQAAYYVQSSFTSSAGYGFLLDRDELSHWRLASDRRDAWQVQANGRGLDYAVMPGGNFSMKALSALTGRQPAPPRWALGTLCDREVRFPSDPPAQYEREIESDIRNFDRYRIHVDGYRIEGWQFLSRVVLRRIFAQLRRRGIHPMVYFRAFVGTDDIGTDDPSLFAYALRHRYVATRADGAPYTFVSNFGRPAAVIDFTNPAAARWWRGRITQALGLGADGFMQDFGEQVQTDMHFHDGSSGVSMHNRYPVLYHRETRRAVDAFRKAHPERQIFFFTRAGYSGTPGGAAYENANFPGDETTDWTRAAGIASLAPDMLNRSVGGAYGFSTDIGGYYDIGPYPPTSKELFLRWAAWAALSPFYRLHGSILAGVHAPWSFDASTVRIYKALARLHARLVPLLVKLWEQADRTGEPVIRPLWLAAPGDPRAAAQDQEWMVGSDLLAAPVVRQSARTRTAYLPVGCWRLRGAGSRISGGRSVTVPAPLEQAVYFTRCGRDPFAVASSPRSLTATATGRCARASSASCQAPATLRTRATLRSAARAFLSPGTRVR